LQRLTDHRQRNYHDRAISLLVDYWLASNYELGQWDVVEDRRRRSCISLVVRPNGRQPPHYQYCSIVHLRCIQYSVECAQYDTIVLRERLGIDLTILFSHALYLSLPSSIEKQCFHVIFRRTTTTNYQTHAPQPSTMLLPCSFSSLIAVTFLRRTSHFQCQP
jgi:hypothetical protein